MIGHVTLVAFNGTTKRAPTHLIKLQKFIDDEIYGTRSSNELQ